MSAWPVFPVNARLIPIIFAVHPAVFRVLLNEVAQSLRSRLLRTSFVPLISYVRATRGVIIAAFLCHEGGGGPEGPSRGRAGAESPPHGRYFARHLPTDRHSLDFSDSRCDVSLHSERRLPDRLVCRIRSRKSLRPRRMPTSKPKSKFCTLLLIRSVGR